MGVPALGAKPLATSSEVSVSRHVWVAQYRSPSYSRYQPVTGFILPTLGIALASLIAFELEINPNVLVRAKQWRLWTCWPFNSTANFSIKIVCSQMLAIEVILKIESTSEYE
jgi:hypothetical protein